MLKNWVYGLLALLFLGCADTSDRYRDIHQLELPPVLPIEHAHTQPVVAADDLKSKPSALADLMAFEDDGVRPILTLKTRPERAWEMVAVALKISNIEVLDKNREENRFQVRYDPDMGGKEESILDVFFNNDYAEAEYIVTLKQGIIGMVVNTALSKPDELEFGEDGSAELLRLLHQVINEKIINRDRQTSDE